MVTAPAATSRRHAGRKSLSVLLGLGLLALYLPARQHSRAASLLMHLADRNAHGFVADYNTQPVRTEPISIHGPAGPIRAKLYVPHDSVHAPGMVVLHGIHHLGIEEPRLVNFSSALASHGMIVLTPEMADLADYHVEPAAIEVIGAAVHDLAGRTGAKKVGVLGLSFAGGLGLIAAADTRFAPEIEFVTAVGAHDDLGRVMRFFATNEIQRPDGSTLHMQAHEYGPLVVAYSHPEGFFPPQDTSIAREAIRLWLWEQPAEARKRAEGLPSASRAKLDQLFDHHIEVLRPELLASIDKYRAEIAAVSPSGKLGSIACPVLLLHGAGDNVIPPSETEWLAKEVPSDKLQEALISPAISHVEIGGSGPGLRDKLNLVHFMAEMLSEADDSPRSTVPISASGQQSSPQVSAH